MTNTRPKIREDKTRFNITIQKTHKAHLEEIASDLGISLNSLIIQTVMKAYPMKKEK